MHDVIIIGAGPAGLSAAFWCDELGLDTLALEEKDTIGGQLHRVYNPITNYLGLKAANGGELVNIFGAGLDEADFDLWTGVDVADIDLRSKRVSLRSGEQLQSIAIIVATGVRRRKLGIPGETEFAGRGMIESATKDRTLYADQDVCVVGGGDAAAENALLLAEVCSTVTLIHRGKQLRARQEFTERLKSDHRVTVFTDSTLKRVIGNEAVEAVEVERREGIKPFQIAVKGVLVRVGVEPNTEQFGEQFALDEQGYVKVDSVQETSVPFIFAVGDVANPLAPTISGAVGSGATAAKVIAAKLNSSGRKLS